MSRFGIRSLVIIMLLLVGANTGTAQELSAADTAALLQRLREHRENAPALTAQFSEEKTSRLLKEPLVSEGTLAFQVPNKFRREIKGANASTTVSDGRKLWIYYPNFKQAELYVLGQRAFFDDSIAALTAGLNFQQIGEFYKVRAFREGSSSRLVLTPKSGGLKRMLKELTVTVDQELRIDRTIALLPKGDRLVTVYRNPRPTPLPLSTFEFTPPAGAEVSQPLGK